MSDWPSYNESLVRRGQVLLDFDVLDRWDQELFQMNLGKIGEPYCYPDSFIQLLGYMRAYFHLPYRQTQGVVIAHANKVPNTPHYSTISRRINILEIKIHNEKLGNDIVIALDSTGIKVANRGEWMRHKWHVRKGYLKIHITVDIKNKRILSLEVTSEEIHDGKILKKLVDDASENNKIKRVLADGMYDSNKNFRYLSKNHIKSGIKTRSNSKARTCIARRLIRVKISYIYVTIIRIKDRGNWTLTHSYSCCYLVIFFLFILPVEKSTQTVV